MLLRQLNIDKINAYGKYKFIKDLENLIHISNGQQRNLLRSVLLYYIILFEVETNMADDVMRMQPLAEKNIKMLTHLQHKHPNQIIGFLIDLISENVEYVKNIKKIAI